VNCSYTFAISLPRYPERYKHIEKQLQEKVVDRYEILGVDGRALSLFEVVAAEEKARGMSPGQVGCALSHLAVYRRMKELNLPHAFVVEDDVVLPGNIESIVSACLPYLTGRSVISLYSPRPSPTPYSSRGAPVLPQGQLLSPTTTLDTQTTTAYLIGSDAAAAIIGCNSPVRHIADHWFAFYAEGAIEKVLLHYPMPVNVAHFDSSIVYDRGYRTKLKALAMTLPPLRRALYLKRLRLERQQTSNIVVVDTPTFYEP
jgi:glycosyl transferase, family 25